MRDIDNKTYTHKKEKKNEKNEKETQNTITKQQKIQSFS